MIINPYSFGVAYDPDAQAFITAAGITDNTQKTAINTLVLDMKGYGIWTKMKAIYPFVGGTASTHKWNLKDPRDLDAAFRLVFSGGMTHSSNGILFGGVNGYCDTKLNMSTNYAVNTSTHISFYNRISAGANVSAEMGVFDGSIVIQLYVRRSDFSNQTYYNVNTGSPLTFVDTNGAAFYIANRSGTTMNGFRNLVKTVTQTSAAGTRPSLNMFIGNLNVNGFPNSGLYSSRQCAFASIGDGLTDTEAANFYTAVQNFNTTLTRNV
jgi:hypothetical protein